MVNVNATASPARPAMSSHTALSVGTPAAGPSPDGSVDGSKLAAVSVTASERLVRLERERPGQRGRRVPPVPLAHLVRPGLRARPESRVPPLRVHRPAAG